MAIVHSQPLGGDLSFHVLDADPMDGAGTAANTGDWAIWPGNASFLKLAGGDTDWLRTATFDEITDPGDAGAIPVTQSGFCMITSAAGETRTLAIPTFKNQRMLLFCTVYVGDIAITVGSPIDTVPGNTVITMGNVGDSIELVAIDQGGTLAWRWFANNGCALT